MQNIGPGLPTTVFDPEGAVPLCVSLYRGKVFSGTGTLSNSEHADLGVAAGAKAFIIRTPEGSTTATVDTNYSNICAATIMAKFPFDTSFDLDACLFIGMLWNDTINSAEYAPIVCRVRDEELSPGVPLYATVTPDTALFSTGAQTKNFWSGFAEFEGNFYAAHWNAGIVNIFKYVPAFDGSLAADGNWLPTGGSDTDGGTWTRVYTSAAGAPALRMAVANSKLYAFGGLTDANAKLLIETDDGTTWTDRTSRMIAGPNQRRFGAPLIFVPPAS
jgi:hypothetical protein